MFGHTSRFQSAMSFAAILGLWTAVGAAAESSLATHDATIGQSVMAAGGTVVSESASGPDMMTAATSNAAAPSSAALASEPSLVSGESAPSYLPNRAAIENASPSRFNQTIDRGE